MFTDSARTTHHSLSPRNILIPATVGGLTHVQSSTGDAVNSNGWDIDNLKVYNNATPDGSTPSTNIFDDNG